VTAEFPTADGQNKLDMLALRPLRTTSVSVVLTLTDKPIPDVDAVVAVRAQVSHFEQSGCK